MLEIGLYTLIVNSRQYCLLCFAQHLESLSSLLTFVSVSIFLSFFCFCRLLSTVWIILALCCSTPRVTVLILDLSPSFRLNLSSLSSAEAMWPREEPMNLCCFVFLNPSTPSTRRESWRWQLSYFRRTGSCNCLCSVWRPNLLLLMFHSLKLLSISTNCE